MDKKKHKARHKLLHRYFDELIADFISHTKSMPGHTTVAELIEWSYIQTTNPTEDE